MKVFISIMILSFLLLSCSENNTNSTEVKAEKPTAVEQTINKSNKSDLDSTNEKFVLNTDYEALPVPYNTETTDQVVVYEFFGYTCPHCFTFEPFINKWLETKPDYVKFVRIPLNFQPGWANFQQAYLTAEAMGLVEKTHIQLFEALHKENKRFNTIEELADWYANETGVDKEAFISTSDSFILDSKMRKADSMGFNMQITSTPTLIINGKYRAAKKIHSRDKIMDILDFLIKKEAKSMGLLTE